MKKAIFLDRDGVINNPKDCYYVHRIKDFQFNKTVLTRLQEYTHAGFLLVIITNQGGISKGEYTREDVEKLHEHMLTIFAENKILISAVYYCPHHDKFENCLCRKPKSLMIEKGLARFEIRCQNAVMIGDSKSDVSAAESAGIKGILIPKNSELPSLAEIVDVLK